LPRVTHCSTSGRSAATLSLYQAYTVVSPPACSPAQRIADGVVLPEGSTPAAVRWAREQAGGETTAYAWFSDSAAALRPQVEQWVARGNYPVLYELAGLDGDVTDDDVRALTVSGDPAACADAIAARHAAGAASVVLLPYTGDPDAQVALIGAEVLPRLR